MAISYVGGQVGEFAGKTGTTTVTFALTGGSASVPAAGDLVVVSYAVGSTADRALTITNASAVDYTLAGTELYQDDTYDTNLRVAYRFMPGTPETTFILSGTGSIQDAGAYTIHVYRGVHTVTPMDVTVVTAGNINTRLVDPGAITPTTTGAWIQVSGGAAGGTGGTFAAGYLTDFRVTTRADTNDVNIGSGYYTGWTSGSYDPAAFTGGGTDTTSDSWAAVTLALRPANPVSVSAASVAMTLTGFAAAVLLSVSISAGFDAMTTTAHAATVDVASASRTVGKITQPGPHSLTMRRHGAFARSADVLVDASTQALSLTEQAADVNLNVSVSATAPALVLTEQAAAVNAEINVGAGFDALALTEQAAAVTLDANVGATFATLTLTEQAATIAAAVNVQSSAASLAITENAAAINAAISVQAGSDALALTEQAATVALNVAVAAGLDALVLTEQAATVDVGGRTVARITQPGPHGLTMRRHGDFARSGNVIVEATAVSLTLTELAATVDTGADVTVSATSQALILTEYAATVAALDLIAPYDYSLPAAYLRSWPFRELVPAEYPAALLITAVEVSATSQALVLTEQTANVNAAVSIAAGIDALVLTENAANVNAEISVTAGFDALVLTEQAANVNAAVSIAAGIDALALTSHAASVQIGSDIEVSAASQSLALTEQPATVNAAISIAAGLDALALTEQAATVNASVVVSAETDALAITAHTASVTTLAVPTPAERTAYIAVENRIMAIPGYSTTLSIRAENRVMAVTV